MDNLQTVWLGGNKFIVGSVLAAAIQTLQASWQEEHDQKIRLEERLKAASGMINNTDSDYTAELLAACYAALDILTGNDLTNNTAVRLIRAAIAKDEA